MHEALADWTWDEKNALLNNLKRLFESLQKFD